MFLKHYQFIIGLGECNLIPIKYKEAETFVCLIYGIDNVDSEDAACRVIFMFQKGSQPEIMPPTKDALQLHIQYVHHPCRIWKLALCTVFLMLLRWDGHETIDCTRFWRHLIPFPRHALNLCHARVRPVTE